MRTVLIITWFVCVSCVSHAQSGIVTSPDFDFGVVKQGEPLSHVFQIWNTGDAALHIDKIDMSAAGLTSRFRDEVLPSEAAPITVEWNTNGFSGDVEATAIIYTDDVNQPQIQLHLKATVKPPIEFDPFPAVFFTVYQDESPEKHIRIVNHEDSPLDLGKVDAPENHYMVQLKTIRPGKEFDLAIQVRPEVPFGRYTEPIYIETNLLPRPRLQIQANLFVKPELYAFPEKIDFGPVSLSDLEQNPRLARLLSHTTIVTSRTHALEILSIHSDIPFLRFAYDEPEGPQHKYRVTVDLIRENLKIGRVQGVIAIRTTDESRPVLEIPVQGEIR